MHLGRLFLLLLGLATPAVAQQGGGSAYAIGGIRVDIAAPNPETARNAAFRIAQRAAWAQLWSRLTGNAVAGAPKLTDGQLDGIVSGIESQGETFSMTRYIATLGVVFDRSRARAYLSGSGETLQSPPMLLLPLFSDGGVRTLYQAKTPWREAWARYRENVTPIDYVVASGSAGDNVLLTSWQVTRPDRPSWRNILNRFDAVDVLTAEARLTRAYPGGPVAAVFIARHGPDATELARFALNTTDDDGVPAMLDRAVAQIDEIYAIALRDGRLRSEPDLTAELEPIIGSGTVIGAPLGGLGGGELPEGTPVASLEAVMITPDAATATALESQLRGTAGVTGVTITSLSLGGTSRLILNYAGAYDVLLFALDERGLRLAPENGETVLRRRRDGDPPIPRPVVVAPVDPLGPAAPDAPLSGPVPPAPPPVLPPALPPPPPADAARRPRAEPRQPATPAAAPPAPGNAPVDLLTRPQP